MNSKFSPVLKTQKNIIFFKVEYALINLNFYYVCYLMFDLLET